uniref:Uncharacterized protein n=1 Tax=Brassica campestris TaxID=3711 RepID=A0A3P6CNL2_BRACM|nr:unnamed protein product [Brassica rapa]
MSSLSLRVTLSYRNSNNLLLLLLQSIITIMQLSLITLLLLLKAPLLFLKMTLIRRVLRERRSFLEFPWLLPRRDHIISQIKVAKLDLCWISQILD